MLHELVFDYVSEQTEHWLKGITRGAPTRQQISLLMGRVSDCTRSVPPAVVGGVMTHTLREMAKKARSSYSMGDVWRELRVTLLSVSERTAHHEFYTRLFFNIVQDTVCLNILHMVLQMADRSVMNKQPTFQPFSVPEAKVILSAYWAASTDKLVKGRDGRIAPEIVIGYALAISKNRWVYLNKSSFDFMVGSRAASVMSFQDKVILVGQAFINDVITNINA